MRLSTGGPMAYVYLLRDPSSNLIKIGRATNLEQRLRNLRTANPNLELVHAFENVDAVKVEGCLHKKFAIYQQDGEFFDVSVEKVIEYGEEVIGLTSIFNNPELKKLHKIECTTSSLTASPEDWKLINKLTEIDSKIANLELEREVLISQLKLRVGRSSGIQRLVSWKNRTTNRFDQNLFREEHESLFERYKKSVTSRFFVYHRFLKN